MPLEPGIFRLKTAEHLLRKLERDLAAVRQDPVDSCKWFNFFVTAEHIPEWHFYPDDKQPGRFRKKHAVLRICSHIANGGKHFVVRDKRHTSVEGTHASFCSVLHTDGREEMKPEQASQIHEEFLIDLDEREAGELGTASISVGELAERILDVLRAEVLGGSDGSTTRA